MWSTSSTIRNFAVKTKRNYKKKKNLRQAIWRFDPIQNSELAKYKSRVYL
jgi:hypothetical protein